MCGWQSIIYECFTYAYTLYVSIWSEKVNFLHAFVHTSQNIIHVGLLTIWLYIMRVSAGWWLEWLCNLIPASIWISHTCFVKFLLVFVCKSTFQLIYIIYILVGFNHLSMVITNPYNGLDLCFPDISTRAMISCEPLLHWYN